MRISRPTNSSPSACAFCRRQTDLTFHHFIPRKVHRRAHFKKNYSKHALQQGIKICRACHSGIHRQYDEMTLAKEFSTKEALENDRALQTHFAWVSKQKVSR